MDKLEKLLMPLASAIGKNKYLMAIRDGFLISTPLLIVGSVFLLLANFPIAAWTDFVENCMIGDFSLAALLSKQSDATFTIMAIFATMGIGYYFAREMKTTPIFGAAVALMSWFILMPYNFTAKIAGLADATGVAVNVPEGATSLVRGLDLGWLGAKIVAYIFLHLFWFFGINGGSVVGAVFNPILQTLALENLNLYREVGAAGYTVQNGAHIISQQFQDLFATFGGAGSTLSLLIAMLLFCRSKRIKDLGKLSLVPGIFGINEPIIFGLPIVLNPVMLIPFVLVPTVNIILSYFAMNMGMFPPCNGINIPWTMPVIISGFLATNWVGALFQAGLLVLGVFIYLPFIKAMDKQYLEDEQKAMENQEEEIDLDDFSFDDL